VAADTQMSSNALTFIEDLDGRSCRAHLHQLLHQVVRHAVIVGVERDVVIDVHAGAGPLAEIGKVGETTR